MNTEALKTRVVELISFAQKVEATKTITQRMGHTVVSKELFTEFRAAGLSFISNVFGENHSFYREFDKAMGEETNSYFPVIKGRGVLQAIKQELDGGWLFKVKSLVAAEIFTDFLDMANYLLTEGYKDPAAVMIGGVLEEHLHQLCDKHEVDSSVIKDGKAIPKSADRMNADLTGAGVYSKLYQKGVTGWLDLRNKAAHGHYSDYDKAQVVLMEQSVIDFINKTS